MYGIVYLYNTYHQKFLHFIFIPVFHFEDLIYYMVLFGSFIEFVNSNYFSHQNKTENSISKTKKNTWILF